MMMMMTQIAISSVSGKDVGEMCNDETEGSAARSLYLMLKEPTLG
jgi:hypothetical protein